MFAATQANILTASQTPFLPTMAKRTASESSEPVAQEAQVVSVEDFDASLFATKARGLRKDGQRVYITSYNHKKLNLNLTPGSAFLEIKYRIQASDYAQNDNRMKAKFVASEKVAAVISSIEEEVKKIVKVDLPDLVWSSSLKNDIFAANLVLEAKTEAYLTQCRVRPFQKDVVAAAGKEQLQPLLKENSGFMGGKAKVMATLEAIWIMKNSGDAPTVGLDWKIHTMMVSLPEQIRYVVPDVFANASWDDFEE
jgi:hypothetical protein